MELLSIRSLSRMVGISLYTAANWIEDFDVYIPKTEERDATYYYPDAVDVLKRIKKWKAKNYENAQIKIMLANYALPTNQNHAMKETQTTLDHGNDKENMLTIMQTIGKTVSNVTNQEKIIHELQEQQRKQLKRIKKLEKQVEDINELKQEIATLKREIASNNYETSKASFARLFH